MNNRPADALRIAERMLQLGALVALVLLLRSLQAERALSLFGWIFLPLREGGFEFLVAGIACLAGSLVLRNRAWRSKRAAAVLAGKFLLAGCSLAFALWVGETLLRVELKRSRGFDAFRDFQTFQAADHQAPVGLHALSVITYIAPNPRIIYDLKPNLDMTFGDVHLQTNRIGIRDRDYPVKAEAGVRRIVGIGDSGMWGWGVEEPECFLSVLEESLNHKGERYDVINLGVPGYNTRQEVSMLEYKGLQFEPELVVLHWCANDFMLPFYLYRKPDLDRRDISFLFARIFDRTGYDRLVKPVPIMFTDIDEKVIDPALVESSGTEGVRAALKDLHRLGTEHGFKVFAFGPMGEETEQVFRDAQIAFRNTFRELPMGSHPGAWKVHHDHPTAEGHRYLGEQLEGWLREGGFLE